MKSFIYTVIILIAAIVVSSLPIKAQPEVPDTVKIKLSVKSGVIKIDPSSPSVLTGTEILFYTTDSYTFSVLINNYDYFFDIHVTPLILNISAGNGVTLTVGSPPAGDTVKTYSVGIVNPKKPIPVPPESPPKLIKRD
jgi:hypothetical protein